MMTSPPSANPISPGQCKAARVLANVDLMAVAAEAGLSPRAIETFEGEGEKLDASQLHGLRQALEALGIQFLSETACSGPGVRLRFSADQARRIEAWEGEGGTPGDDDVR